MELLHKCEMIKHGQVGVINKQNRTFNKPVGPLKYLVRLCLGSLPSSGLRTDVRLPFRDIPEYWDMSRGRWEFLLTAHRCVDQVM